MNEKIAWSEFPDVNKRLLELDARGYKQVTIGSIIFKEYPTVFTQIPTRNAVKNALAAAREKAVYLRQSPVAQIMPYYDKYRPYIEGVKSIEKNIALLETILAKPRRKILVLSDIHVPFTDEQKLQKAIDLNRTADMVILGGDVMDMYGCSRHRKRKSVPHEVEIDNTVRLLEYLSKTFPWVRVIRGNHDTRPLKKVQDVLPADLLYLVDEEPLDKLTKPFSNVEYLADWWTQIGDMIVAHAERSSTVEGRPAVLLAEFFNVKGWQKRLNLGDVRLFIQAHTHQISSVYREDVKMMECGCMAQVMEYTLDSTAMMRPPMNGCIIVTQDHGVTDFNETREFVL